MFEDPLFRNEPYSGSSDPPDDYDYLEHIYTQNLPETPYTLSIFKAHSDEYEANAGDGLHRYAWYHVQAMM
jgi:alpha-glucosidase